MEKKCYAVVYSNLADHWTAEIYLDKEKAAARAKHLNENNIEIDGSRLNIEDEWFKQGHRDNKYVIDELPLFE